MLLQHDHSEFHATLVDVFSALEAARSSGVLGASTYFGPTGAPPQQIVRDIITRLRADHDFFMIEIAAAVKELREQRRGERQDKGPVIAKVREQMSRVRDRLEAHNELEESQVYYCFQGT
jgi:hypothetical protein